MCLSVFCLCVARRVRLGSWVVNSVPSFFSLGSFHRHCTVCCYEYLSLSLSLCSSHIFLPFSFSLCESESAGLCVTESVSVCM